MKKAVSLMMAAAMTMGLAACGSTASTDTAASAADTASSTEAAASTADSTAAADGKVYNIGICQLVQHEALDAATQGFKDALVEKLGEGSVKFDEQNASGDSANCATIVNGFVSNGVDLDLAGVFEFGLDLLGKIVGEQDHVVLGDFLGLDHDADLAAGLDGVGFFDAGEGIGQLFELFESADIVLDVLTACTGACSGDGVDLGKTISGN